MAIITYRFADGHYEGVEVTEEFAAEYEKLEKEERRRWWREKNRRGASLDSLMEKGIEFPDLNSLNPEEMLFEDKSGSLDFSSCLTEYQFKVADMRFNKHMTCREIAEKLGTSTASVSKLLKKIVKKIYRTFLDYEVKL